MLVVGVAALAAAAVVLAGSAAQLARLPLTGVRLLVAAAALQIAVHAVSPGRAAGAAAAVVSIALVGLFLAINTAVAGVPLVAAGFAANVVVIVANGAMPVSLAAAHGAGVQESRLILEHDALREPMTSDTRLAALGDIIPVALPWYPHVVSAGDVLVAAGVALMLVKGAPPRGARRRQASTRDTRTTACANESTTRGSYS